MEMPRQDGAHLRDEAALVVLLTTCQNAQPVASLCSAGHHLVFGRAGCAEQGRGHRRDLGNQQRDALSFT